MDKVTAGRDAMGEFAPKFAQLNDDVLFGEVWSREDQLSPRDREILLLYYEEGLSYQEMADRLGIPLSTCGTRLARAKAHCKTYLTQPPKGGDDAQ